MAKKGAFGTITIAASAVGEVSRISLSASAREIDTTIMGTGNARTIPGAVEFTLDADVFWETADAGQAALRGIIGSDSASAIVYHPLGAGATLPEWTGNVFIISYDIEQSADGAVELKFSSKSDENGLTYGAQT